MINKFRHIWVALAIVLLLAFTFLFMDFVGDTKVYFGQKPVEKADAIVVLTGGKGRAEEGLNLLRQGMGGVLILSGVHTDADLKSIFFYRKIEETEKDRIILDKRSRSTYENAVEVRRITAERGLDSVILITSGYHMKRADFIFRRVMPKDVMIVNYIAFTPNFDENRWWSGRSLALLLIEFFKYQWYTVRFAFGS